ncbi:MAG: replication-associated recombination protein A [Bdellovibrionales bacterium]|nr:replication-associated recombination protein A [Bdellovibrionales bacterium]
MSKNLSLFGASSLDQPERLVAKVAGEGAPLAERLRPACWEEFVGFGQLPTGIQDLLRSGNGRAPSLLLWGPPGSGKTTLAKLFGKQFKGAFYQLSAVLDGVKEIRDLVKRCHQKSGSSLLFIDEIHRFNKAQQDALLPHVESGTFILFGATTENPSFYLTKALLSRCKVISLRALEPLELAPILERAQRELGLVLSSEVQDEILTISGGDARAMLNIIEELSVSVQDNHEAVESISLENFRKVIGSKSTVLYDRNGEEHYNIASALIKSLRGSDPDAALYWAFRIIEGGEDPRFVFRRLIIFASEDIGNADPRALTLAVSAAEAFDRVGLPEGKIPLAQAITYLATAPKSNRSYLAMKEAEQVAQEFPRELVPLHLRNAPTGLMQNLGYGEGYKYPHDFDDGWVEQQYMPDRIKQSVFYNPSDSGYEKVIGERQSSRKKKSL